eukprot:Nk52_evm4s154 gene=Nk52_evmTU4s154
MDRKIWEQCDILSQELCDFATAMYGSQMGMYGLMGLRTGGGGGGEKGPLSWKGKTRRKIEREELLLEGEEEKYLVREVMYLERLEVEPDFRKKGVAEFVLEMLQRVHPALLVAQALPLRNHKTAIYRDPHERPSAEEKAATKAAIGKIRARYRSYGFKFFSDLDGGQNESLETYVYRGVKQKPLWEVAPMLFDADMLKTLTEEEKRTTLQVCCEYGKCKEFIDGRLCNMFYDDGKEMVRPPRRLRADGGGRYSSPIKFVNRIYPIDAQGLMLQSHAELFITTHLGDTYTFVEAGSSDSEDSEDEEDSDDEEGSEDEEGSDDEERTKFCIGEFRGMIVSPTLVKMCKDPFDTTLSKTSQTKLSIFKDLLAHLPQVCGTCSRNSVLAELIYIDPEAYHRFEFTNLWSGRLWSMLSPAMLVSECGLHTGPDAEPESFAKHLEILCSTFKDKTSLAYASSCVAEGVEYFSFNNGELSMHDDECARRYSLYPSEEMCAKPYEKAYLVNRYLPGK